MENKEITIDYNTHISLHFPDKSFNISGEMLREAIDFYSSEKLVLKASITSSIIKDGK